MRVIKHPSALPGKCGVCGSAERQKFIDTNLSFDYYGALYICNQCVQAMATKLKLDTTTFGDLSAVTNHLKTIEALIGDLNDANDRRIQLIDRAEQHMRIISDLLDASEAEPEDSGSSESESAAAVESGTDDAPQRVGPDFKL